MFLFSVKYYHLLTAKITSGVNHIIIPCNKSYARVCFKLAITSYISKRNEIDINRAGYLSAQFFKNLTKKPKQRFHNLHFNCWYNLQQILLCSRNLLQLQRACYKYSNLLFWYDRTVSKSVGSYDNTVTIELIVKLIHD